MNFSRNDQYIDCNFPITFLASKSIFIPVGSFEPFAIQQFSGGVVGCIPISSVSWGIKKGFKYYWELFCQFTFLRNLLKPNPHNLDVPGFSDSWYHQPITSHKRTYKIYGEKKIAAPAVPKPPLFSTSENIPWK